MSKRRKRAKAKGAHAKKKTDRRSGGRPGLSSGMRSGWIIGAITLLVLALIIIFNSSELKRTIREFVPKSSTQLAGLDDLDYFPTPRWSNDTKEPAFEDFLGAEACASCHKEQYDLWKESTHGQAGGSPKEVDVIGKFGGPALKYGDAEVTPYVTDDHEYKFVVEHAAAASDEITVDAVVGGGHMIGGGTQSYFSKFPDGTYKFLPFDFIREENLWFSQIRKNNRWFPVNGELFLAELSEWPPNRILGTESSLPNCQNCHGSQILVDYNLKQKKYVTQFTSLRINCESCHGPGKKHVALMQSDQANDLEDIGMNSLSTLGKDESLKVCFQCHAVKDPIKNNYLPGKRLEAYYSLKMPILGQNPYLEDGRVRNFAYQQNHLFSDCYLNGSMTCVDCHTPHSNWYRDITGSRLNGRFDNGQCLGCHSSKSQSPESHSNHKPGSDGNLCVSCHMPYLQHKSIGNQLRFSRSDHTIPIPRPEFDAAIGIENACLKCHGQRTVSWLQEKVEEWYGKVKPHNPAVSALLDTAGLPDLKTAGDKLLVANEEHPMAQAIGLSYFAKRSLSPDMPGLGPEVISKLKELAESADLDVKSLALMSLHLAAGRKEEIRNHLTEELEQLGKDEIPVRMRWAIALDYLGTIYSQNGDMEKAVALHKKALEINPEDPVALVNLGSAYGNTGRLNRAMGCFRRAAELKPDYDAALHNLGTALRMKGDIPEAIESYKRAIEIKPVGREAYLLLARTYIESRQMQNAREVLRDGLNFNPNDTAIRNLLNDLNEPRLR